MILYFCVIRGLDVFFIIGDSVCIYEEKNVESPDICIYISIRDN
jgi:hypothetical protein